MKIETCTINLQYADDCELEITGVFDPSDKGDDWTPPTADEFEITHISHKGVDVTNVIFNIIGLCESKLHGVNKMSIGYALENLCIEQILEREFDAETDY